MHYYKFNIADWHLATSHLSLEEEAIYFKLVNFYYDTETPIPLETQTVIRRLRLGMHMDSVRLVLDEFFVKNVFRIYDVLSRYKAGDVAHKAHLADLQGIIHGGYLLPHLLLRRFTRA